MLQPGEACNKTGEPIIDVLQKNQLDAHAPYDKILNAYSGYPPGLVPLELTENIITEVARHILEKCRDGGHILIHTPTLAYTLWGCKWRAEADCLGCYGVVRKCTVPIVQLPCANVWSTYQTRKSAWILENGPVGD